MQRLTDEREALRGQVHDLEEQLSGAQQQLVEKIEGERLVSEGMVALAERIERSSPSPAPLSAGDAEAAACADGLTSRLDAIVRFHTAWCSAFQEWMPFSEGSGRIGKRWWCADGGGKAAL